MLLLFILTLIVHSVDTSAYAARLAGVRTGRPAMANSLYNVLSLVARIANALAAPILSSLADVTLAENLTTLHHNYQQLLLAAAIGTLIAALFLPTCSRILATGVLSYEHRGSLPQVIIQGTSVQGLWKMQHQLTQPRLAKVIASRRSPFPLSFLISNILVIALFTVANYSSLYASVLVPEGARTASSLAPLFTGIGVILNYIWIDPLAAQVSDSCMRGERPLYDVTYITIWQIGARFIGTLLAQLLLLPLAWMMAEITRWILP